MHVRMHQFIIEQPETMLLLGPPEDAGIDGEILIGLEMELAIIASDDDMIMKLAVLESRRPAHLKKVLKAILGPSFFKGIIRES